MSQRRGRWIRAFSFTRNPQTPRSPTGRPDHREITEQAIEATRAAAGIALTEHHSSDYNTYCNNFMLASYLRRLFPAGTNCLLAVAVPLPPDAVAQSCNLLDILPKGDLIVGLPRAVPLWRTRASPGPATRAPRDYPQPRSMEAALTSCPRPHRWGGKKIKKKKKKKGEWHTVLRVGLRSALDHAGRLPPGEAGLRALDRTTRVALDCGGRLYLSPARDTPTGSASASGLLQDSANTGARRFGSRSFLDWSMVQKQSYLARDDAED